MIKILKKRNKVKCKICKSEFSFEPKDIIDNLKTTRCKDGLVEEHNYTINCPVCTAINILGSSIIDK